MEIISVKNLSKKYYYNRLLDKDNTLHERFSNFFKQPLHFIKNIKDNNNNYFWALENINFEITKGEVVGIIGANGAGKTTLLEIISRVTPPTKGRVVIKGRVGSLLEVGTGFHPELSGRENVYLNGVILGMKKIEIEKKFNDIVEFSGIKDLLDTPIKKYSSGMRLRLAFSVASFMELDVLLLDEVLTVGDYEFQKKCFNKINEMAGSGDRTILFVSHNLNLIHNLCRRCVWLDQGKIIMDGPSEKVVEAYLNKLDSIINTSLGQRLDRVGNQKLKFIDFNLMNSENEKIKAVFHNSALKLELIYYSAQKLKNIIFAIGINDHLGNRCLTLSSNFHGSYFNLDAGNGAAILNVENFSLRPGRYAVTLYAALGSEVYDQIDNAFYIDVLANKNSKYKVYPTKNQGYSLASYRWS